MPVIAENLALGNGVLWPDTVPTEIYSKAPINLNGGRAHSPHYGPCPVIQRSWDSQLISVLGDSHQDLDREEATIQCFVLLCLFMGSEYFS